MTMDYHGVYKAGVGRALARVAAEYADTLHIVRVDSQKSQVLSCKRRDPIVTAARGHFYTSPAVYCSDCGATLDVRI